jgi:anti-sigma factor RsiW
MTGKSAITEDILAAYADDRLNAETRAAVEAWLAGHPERAAEIAAWRQQNLDLRAAFPEPAADETPQRLDPRRIARQIDASRPRRSVIAFAAAAALVFGLGLGWWSNMLLTPRPSVSGSFITAALAAHTIYTAEGRHAVEVGADEEDHLTTWLSNRLDRRLVAPDLTSDGFELVGGRLLYTADIPAAQLMYENEIGERLTLYFTGEVPDGEAAYRFASRGELAALYWAGEAITCTVVGNLSRAELEDVARKAYEQLTWPASGSNVPAGNWGWG